MVSARYTVMPRGKHTRGRQKIPIKLIRNQDDLYACFSKRRSGLFKKASELSTLCGADVGVLVFSPTDNPFSFFSPSMDAVLDRFHSPGQQPLRHSAFAIDAHARACIRALNKRLDGLSQQKVELQERQRRAEEAERAREKAWWEEAGVEGLDRERVKEWMAWFGDFKDRVERKVAEMSSNSAAAYVDHSGGGVALSISEFVFSFQFASGSNQGGNQFI